MITQHKRPALFPRLFPALLALLLSVAASAAPDFDAEYQALLDTFPDAMVDTAAAEALVDKANELYERIRDYRRSQRSELSSEEYDRLRDLYKEVRGFRSVTRVVGQISNIAYVKIEAFDQVNARLGLEPQLLQSLDSGLELVRIDVGDYGSLLFRNPTKTTYSTIYQVSGAEEAGGVGNAACESYSVLSGKFNSRNREIEDREFEVRTQGVGVKGCR